MNMLPILMAEDDPQDQMIAIEALRKAKLANRLICVENGELLMDYLKKRSPYEDSEKFPTPGIILLDLNMPRKNGHEVLKEIKSDPFLKHIPVVILTTSTEEEEVLQTYKLGASSYICKPVDIDELVKIMIAIGKYWFSIVELPDEQNSS